MKSIRIRQKCQCASLYVMSELDMNKCLFAIASALLLCDTNKIIFTWSKWASGIASASAENASRSHSSNIFSLLHSSLSSINYERIACVLCVCVCRCVLVWNGRLVAFAQCCRTMHCVTIESNSNRRLESLFETWSPRLLVRISSKYILLCVCVCFCVCV